MGKEHTADSAMLQGFSPVSITINIFPTKGLFKKCGCEVSSSQDHHIETTHPHGQPFLHRDIY